MQSSFSSPSATAASRVTIARMKLLRLALPIAAAMVASAAPGQQPMPVSEFGRVSGGQVDVVTKGTGDLSGSLAIMSLGSREEYGATLGGTLLEDRLWFFGAGALPGATDAKMTAQLGSRNSVNASFSRTSAESTSAQALPSSFMSLRYDGMASGNFFFSASFLRLR